MPCLKRTPVIFTRDFKAWSQLPGLEFLKIDNTDLCSKQPRFGWQGFYFLFDLQFGEEIAYFDNKNACIEKKVWYVIFWPHVNLH